MRMPLLRFEGHPDSLERLRSGHHLSLIEDLSDVSLTPLDTSDITHHLNKI